jgi:hypothetical protein
MSESVDTTVLLEVFGDIRKEMREHRTLLLESIAQGRSFEMQVDAHLLALDQRVKELKDDLEVLIRSEVIGLLGDDEVRGSNG